MSPEERLRRLVQEKKFYATLPKKVDNAVDEYLAATPKDDPDLDWEFEEVGEFGQEGWTISFKNKSVSKNND